MNMNEDNRENNTNSNGINDSLLFLKKVGKAAGEFLKNALTKAKKLWIIVKAKLKVFGAAVSTATKKIAQNASESAKKIKNAVLKTLWPALRKGGTAAAAAVKEFFADVGAYMRELFTSLEESEEVELPEDTLRRKRMRTQALLLALLMVLSTLLPSLAQANLGEVFAKHDSTFYCEKAGGLIEAGKPEKALRYIKKAEAKAQSEDLAQLCTLKAQYEFYCGNTEEGLKLLEEYMKLQPDDDASRAYIAQYYVTYGYYNEALIHYSVLIKHGYNASEVYYLKGVCAMNAEKYSTADEAFTQALTTNSEQTDIYYYRGVCRMQLGSYEEAKADFTRQLEISANDEQNLRYLRGLCCLAMEQGEEAYTDLSYAAGGTDAEISVKAQAMLNEYFL